ncbi:MAG: hypothetical protein JRI89_13510 [Deltaproteobacteria bacterium]|nr:hypothetical protein [Deltaproteobacteria bacterium]
MLTKEKLADSWQRLVQIFPGMPSYQERESLRAQDKHIRDALFTRLDHQIHLLDQLKSDMVADGQLTPLAELDRACRTLHRLADTIRFARYGYAGLFAVAIDEEKLAELYHYDMGMAATIDKVAEAVNTLVQESTEQWQPQLFKEVKQAIDALDQKIRKRESLFNLAAGQNLDR